MAYKIELDVVNDVIVTWMPYKSYKDCTGPEYEHIIYFGTPESL